MALPAVAKALALIIFLAAIGGATYGVEQVIGSTVESQLVSLSVAREQLNATGGHTVTFVVSVANRDLLPRDVSVRIAGIASGASETATVRGNATTGFFVSVDVPEGAPPGDHPLDVAVLVGERVLREREGLVTLRVLDPAPGFQEGDSVEALYVGRLAAAWGGRTFNTNDPAIVGIPFLKTDTYRFSQGVLRVQSLPRPSIVPGLYEGMLGMQAGESRTISFPPELGYGPATEEERFARDDVIERDLTLSNDAQRVPRATFDSYIAESGQGDPLTLGPGDKFLLEQNGNSWPYAVVSIDDQSVEYRLAAEVGDAYTVYPFWPDASVITAIDETEVTFRTTPTTEIGTALTMRAHWPQMSHLASVNETHVVVRHSPPIGFTYSTTTQIGQPREATVQSVTEEEIVTVSPSPNPLAGKDLTFDVLVLSVSKSG
jgi:FKBP-type peptidyl-prolyl cis-trans isomerase 2